MWSVAIFASREKPETLQRTVAAASVAAPGAVIDVIVNGNIALASLVSGARVRHINTPDKANAWNQYVRHWQESEIAFFLDGYAQPEQDAFRLLAAQIRNGAIAASGGLEPGLHGNLFAIRGETLQAMRERGFRLPLGLYRSDGLIGAVLAFNLDPGCHTWDLSRIAFVPEARWHVEGSRSIKTIAKRRLRQAQGMLENLALREHLAVQRKAPEALPRTAAELVRTWIEANPMRAGMLYLRHPLCYFAANKLLAPREWGGLEMRSVG